MCREFVKIGSDLATVNVCCNIPSRLERQITQEEGPHYGSVLVPTAATPASAFARPSFACGVFVHSQYFVCIAYVLCAHEHVSIECRHCFVHSALVAMTEV